MTSTSTSARATLADPAGTGPHRDDVLVVDDVTMHYPSRRSHGRQNAVDAVSLRVKRGEIVALLGRNGAGKSTLIRMICTLTLPTSGRITVGGHDVVTDDDAARRALGVVLGGERSIYWKLTGRQNLHFFTSLRGIRGRAARAAVDEALARVDLIDRADDYVEEYSTGMRQRLVVARALIGDPQIVVLDEPTAGLDPHATASLQDLIVGLRSSGHGVLIATHHVEEAEELADRVAIIDDGRLIACDTPRALREGLGSDETLRCTLSPPPAGELQPFVEGFSPRLSLLAQSGGPEQDGERFDVAFGGRLTDAVVARFMAYAVEQGWTVHALRVEPTTLRHTFLTLTGRDIEAVEPEANLIDDEETA